MSGAMRQEHQRKRSEDSTQLLLPRVRKEGGGIVEEGIRRANPRIIYVHHA